MQVCAACFNSQGQAALNGGQVIEPAITATGRLSKGSAASRCRKLIVDAHGVPMLCAVLKRHSLAPPLQRDGIAALASLCMHSEAGLKALASEKEGVEALVGGMLLCARERLDFSDAKAALQLLADKEEGLLRRIGMANGKKWLRGAAPEQCDPDPEDAPSNDKAEEQDKEGSVERGGEKLPGAAAEPENL